MALRMARFFLVKFTIWARHSDMLLVLPFWFGLPSMIQISFLYVYNIYFLICFFLKFTGNILRPVRSKVTLLTGNHNGGLVIRTKVFQQAFTCT